MEEDDRDGETSAAASRPSFSDEISQSVRVSALVDRVLDQLTARVDLRLHDDKLTWVMSTQVPRAIVYHLNKYSV